MIFFQVALLCFTFIGWGYWVWLAAGFERNRQRQTWFLSMLGGFCACILALQNLIYWGLKLEWTAWFALVIAAAGCFQLGRRWFKGQVPSIGREKDPWIMAVLFLVIFAFQGSGLFHHGPQDYYGNAHTDQVNYTLLSQFLVEEPFSLELENVALRPWLVKAIDLKNMRIGQSVAQGYLGVVSFTDSKTAYGVLTIFFIACISLAVFSLGHALGLSRMGALLAGLWTGLLPAVTKTHLDGFFSQTIILFIYPSMGLLFATTRSFRSFFILSALFLAWLLSAYTEVFIIGVAITACFCLFVLKAPLSIRIASAVSIVTASLLINPYYSLKFIFFLKNQYHTASDPLVLSGLVPNSGTWRGWTEIFWRFDFLEQFFPIRFETWPGIFLLCLMVIGFLSVPSNCRYCFMGTLLPPISVLAYLLSFKTLPKYPFSKILDTFSPFWVLLSIFGVVFCIDRLEPMIRKCKSSIRPLNRKEWKLPLTLILTPFIVFSGFSSFIFLARVIQNSGILSSVNTPQLRQTYKELRKTKGRYLINEEHPIINAWLAYHARKSDVYFEPNKITDRPVPLDQFFFRRIPDNPPGLKLVNASGIIETTSYQGPPLITIRNPQGIDKEGLFTWYWVGDSMEIQFLRFSSIPVQEWYRLTMTVISGPAHPDTHRKVSLIAPEGTQQIMEFDNEATLSFNIELKSGSASYKFQVLSPTEHVLKTPSDPRKLMVRVQELDLMLLK